MTNDELAQRLRLLRDLGVHSFEGDGISVVFAPREPAAPKAAKEASPGPIVPTPAEVLKAMEFGGL